MELGSVQKVLFRISWVDCTIVVWTIMSNQLCYNRTTGCLMVISFFSRGYGPYIHKFMATFFPNIIFCSIVWQVLPQIFLAQCSDSSLLIPPWIFFEFQVSELTSNPDIGDADLEKSVQNKLKDFAPDVD